MIDRSYPTIVARTALVDGECWVPLQDLIVFLQTEGDFSAREAAEVLTEARDVWNLEISLMHGGEPE